MKTKLILLTILCLALLASAAAAREVATATLVDPADLPARTSVPPPEMVGNLNAPYWLLGGWFGGLESYAVMFDPSQQVTCGVGFQVTQVHMYLDFEPADVPVTFDVSPFLGSGVWDPVTGCFVPGPMDCPGPIYTVTIDAAGTYDLALPITCDCAYIYDPTGAPYIYYIGLQYLTAFTARVVSDNVAATCTSYNDWGVGWEDLNPYFTTYGNVNIYGDAVCCTDPVGVEETSWGGVKSLFR